MNGKMIRDIRKRQGMTQEQLAEKAGIKQGYLSGIELGTKTPSIDTLNAIAAALGLQLTITLVPLTPDAAPVSAA